MAQPKPTVPIAKLGRDHIDYWKARVEKRFYEVDTFDRHGKKNGTEKKEVPEYQIRIAHLGRREWFNLQTANEAAAASKAREIYRAIIGKGWTEALAIYKPDMEVTGDGCTVGEFLKQVQAVSELKPGTFSIYAKKFRTLVAGVCKIDGGKAKHDYVNGGYKAWLDRVHAVKLERLTPDKIKEWKLRELKESEGDHAQRKHTSVTVRSILLSSKSLFTVRADDGSREDIRKHISLKLPAVLPFEGVTLPRQGKSRYKGLGGNLTPELLVQAAQTELATDRPEEYKAFLLCFGAGLRRDEADGLEWAKIGWTENTVRVEVTEHSGTKSECSEADVNVDPGLLEILKGYMPKPGMKASKFVIESPVAHRAGAVTYHHYRCDRVFKNLIKWLRSKGIAGRNPLHVLRKEFGSQINKQHGIFAASVALRHSNIAITRDTYVEDRAVSAVFNISKLLNNKAA